MNIKDDGIHYKVDKILPYNALINFVLSGRGPGKSVSTLEMCLRQYKNKGLKTLWFLRYEADFTPRYVDDFLASFTDYPYVSCQEGVFETVLDDEGNVKKNINGTVMADKSKLVIAFMSISTMGRKVKGISTKGIGNMVFDEFIPNLMLPGTRYLKGEAEAFLTCYDTIARNNDFKTKVYFLGNPYQISNPYFTFFNINLDAVRANKDSIYIPVRCKEDIKADDDSTVLIQKGTPYILIDYFNVNPKLLGKRLNTPYGQLAMMNTSFLKTNFYGEEYNTNKPQIVKNQPRGANLLHVIKIQGHLLGIFTPGHSNEYKQHAQYWISEKLPTNYNRTVDTVNLEDFDAGTNYAPVSKSENPVLYYVRLAIRKNDIAVDNENLMDLLRDML